MKNNFWKDIPKWQIIFIGLTTVLYWMFFLTLHVYLEAAPIPLIILPVVVSCWFLGTKRGLMAGGFFLFSAMFFVIIFHFHRGNPVLMALTIITSFALGSAAGWVRKLYDTEKKYSRMLAEEHQALLREIDERRIAEKRAQWDEYFLKTMNNSSPLGVLAINNDTDEVLYCNHRFCEIWNVKQFEEKVLYKQIKSSEFIALCHANVLDKDFYQNHFSPLLNANILDPATIDIKFSDGRIIRRFTSSILSDKDDFLGRLFIYEDVTEGRRSEGLLKRTLDYEHLIYKVSNLFINVPTEKMDDVFNLSLQMVCEFLEMDRGYFYQFDLISAFASNLYEWRSLKVNEDMSRIRHMESRLWPSFFEKIKNFEKIVIPDIATLNLVVAPEKDYLIKRNIKAIILIPVVFNNDLIGVLGFDSFETKAFSDDTDAMLKIISDVFASAFVRKKEHDALLASEERFRLLVQNSADMITLIDREGKLKYVSQATGKILGYTPGERSGMSILQFVHPGDVPKVQAILKTLIDKKSSIAGPQFIRVQHTNGSWIYLESIFTDQLDNPSINGIVINSRDFTQHLAIKEELHNSRNFLNAIINSAGDPMFVKDSSYRWVLVNNAFCKLTGYKKEYLLGKTAYELFSENEASNFLDINVNVLNAGEIRDYEVNFTDAQNNTHFVISRLSTFQAESGEKYIIGNLRDETRRKEMEIEINNALSKEKELNELKSKFISMVSHEYRTPLTTIFSSTELLELYGQGMTADEKQKHLDKIKNSVDYLISMLNEVLLINRAESGRMDFDPSSFELVSFCREIAKNLVIGSKSKIELNADSQSKSVFLDKKLLRHILTNLLSNAVKYSAEGETVSLNVYSEKGFINFEIIDNGIGIPAESQTRIFEPFFRAENVSNISGSGLGLSIVKNCVDLHKGKISFESRSGAGTKFIVNIPVD